MNKIVSFFFCFLYLVSSLEAYQTTFALRSAAFFPISQRFRDVYEDIHPDYQAEASLKLARHLELWENIDYFSKRKYENSCYKTKIKVFNYSLGLKKVYSFSRKLDAYYGLGVSLASLELRNKSCCRVGWERKRKLAIGGVFKSGLRYHFDSRLFLDVFLDYLYQPVHLNHHVDIGGLKGGAGLGVKF